MGAGAATTGKGVASRAMATARRRCRWAVGHQHAEQKCTALLDHLGHLGFLPFHAQARHGAGWARVTGVSLTLGTTPVPLRMGVRTTTFAEWLIQQRVRPRPEDGLRPRRVAGWRHLAVATFRLRRRLRARSTFRAQGGRRSSMPKGGGHELSTLPEGNGLLPSILPNSGDGSGEVKQDEYSWRRIHQPGQILAHLLRSVLPLHPASAGCFAIVPQPTVE